MKLGRIGGNLLLLLLILHHLSLKAMNLLLLIKEYICLPIRVLIIQSDHLVQSDGSCRMNAPSDWRASS